MSDAELAMPLRLDLAELETFAAVAQCGSFHQAAARLHISPSSATARVKRLEERLQTQLLRRTTRRLELTPDGARVFESCARVLRELASMQRALDVRAGQHITIAATPMIAATTVPALIRSYNLRFPDVRVKLLDLQYAQMLAQVERGAADLGIGVFDFDAPGLDFEPLTEEELLVVMPGHHPLAGEPTLSLAQLAASPLMILQRYRGVMDGIAQACRLQHIALPAPAQALNLNTLLGMLDAGNGITLLPRSMAQVNAPRPRAALALTGMPLRRKVGLILASQAALSAAARSFQAHARVEYPRALAAMITGPGPGPGPGP